jgi:hypothetical protein
MSGRFSVGVSITVQLVDDPAGFVVTAELVDNAFDATDALLDNIESQLSDLAEASISVADGRLRQYGNRTGHTISDILSTSEFRLVERVQNTIQFRIAWTHDRAALINYGVGPYTIEGKPILSFIWENAPPSVREMFPHTERVGGDPRVFFPKVEHPGVPSARFIQTAANWFRSQGRQAFA